MRIMIDDDSGTFHPPVSTRAESRAVEYLLMQKASDGTPTTRFLCDEHVDTRLHNAYLSDPDGMFAVYPVRPGGNGGECQDCRDNPPE